LKKNAHPLPEGYDPTDFKGAINQVLEDDFSMGVIYKAKS
jgi:hypothetical protein